MTDYLGALHDYLETEKNRKSHSVRTAKTDETPSFGTFGSFGSTQLEGFPKKTGVEPLPVTVEWLAAQGCENVLQLDVAHIRRHLPTGTAARNRVLLAYVETWLQAADSERTAHKRANAGRRAANVALREGEL